MLSSGLSSLAAPHTPCSGQLRSGQGVRGSAGCGMQRGKSRVIKENSSDPLLPVVKGGAGSVTLGEAREVLLGEP